MKKAEEDKIDPQPFKQIKRKKVKDECTRLVLDCSGLKKKGVSTYLKDLIFQYQFDFIGLQETMVQECDLSLFRKFDTQQKYLWEWIPSKGKSRGIVLGANLDKYDVGSFRKGDYLLQFNLWDKEIKKKWNLLVVYGTAQEEHKCEFLAELSRFCDDNSEPFIIGGDFNILRYAKEKSTSSRLHKHSGIFNAIISFFELKELIMNGGIFTWSNN